MRSGKQTKWGVSLRRPAPGGALSAPDGGAHIKQAVLFGGSTIFTRFKFIQQTDGSYALQTPNRINYVTAENGGGLEHGTSERDNLTTDRTLVQAWEKFRIVDRGDCTYTIQTSSGYFIAVGGDFFHISTDISDPDAAPQIGYNARFELINLGLNASTPVIMRRPGAAQ